MGMHKSSGWDKVLGLRVFANEQGNDYNLRQIGGWCC